MEFPLYHVGVIGMALYDSSDLKEPLMVCRQSSVCSISESVGRHEKGPTKTCLAL